MIKVSTLIRQMAKEGHKLASLEKASVLSASDDPKDQDKAREIRVRHDYESLKKQIGSKKKPTKPAVNEGDVHSGQGEKIQKRTKAWMDKKGQKGAPGLDAMKARTAEHKAKRGVKEEVVTERLGGKGYKPYTSLTGKKVSGDWEDSDRGAGNKAKKRAGGKVEKKSPTYLAHVLNKEEVVDEDTKRTTKGRWVDKKGRSHKFSVSTHTGDETHVSSIVKSQYPAKRVVITGQSSDKQKKKKDTKKKGKKIKESVECDCKGCGQDPCIKCGESHHNIKETVSGGVPMTPQELEIQKKMSRLNMRLARKRNQEMQKAKVQDTETAPEQVKEAKVPAYKVSEGEDRAFNFVRDKLKKKYGDGVLTTGEKPKPPTAKQKAEYAAHKKKIAQQDHRDPTEKASDGRYSDRHSNRGSD